MRSTLVLIVILFQQKLQTFVGVFHQQKIPHRYLISALILIVILWTTKTATAQNAEASIQSGKAAYDQAAYVKALDIFTVGIQGDPSDALYAWRAAVLIKLNRVGEAIADYGEAIQLDSTNSSYFIERGKLWYNSRKFQEAVDDFNAAEKRGNIDTRLIYIRGLCNYRLGFIDRGLRDFNAIATDYADHYNFNNYWGLMLLDSDQFEEAIPYFKKAINIDREKVSAFNNLAAVFNYLEEYEKAAAAAKKAIALDNQLASSVNHLAYARLYQGADEEAKKTVSQAIQLDATYSKSYYTLGLYFEKINDLDRAGKSFEKSMSLTPGYLKFYKYPYAGYLRVKKGKMVKQGPRVQIHSPVILGTPGSLLETVKPYIILEGQAIAGGELRSATINDVPMKLANEGKFRHKLDLLPGTNTFKMVVTDENGLSATKEFQVLRLDVPESPQVEPLAFTGTSYALLLGVSEYENNLLNDLNKPILDATVLKAALETQYNFEAANVRVFKNPTKAKLFKVLENFISLLEQDDQLLIFYAGHGHWDEKLDKGYWLLADASPQNKASWFSYRDLKDYISVYKSDQVLVISDACFSGSIFSGNAPGIDGEATSQRTRKALTSGSLKKVPDESIFHRYLIRYLAENKSPQLPTQNIYNTLVQPIMDETENRPMYGSLLEAGHEGGDFVFFRKD